MRHSTIGAMLCSLALSAGCQTATGTGALAGGAIGTGIGALAGGRNGALVGGLIGAGTAPSLAASSTRIVRRKPSRPRQTLKQTHWQLAAGRFSSKISSA